MIKTTATHTFALKHHFTHSVIIILSQNGKDLGNKFGGYPVRNIGQEKYIERIWKKI